MNSTTIATLKSYPLIKKVCVFADAHTLIPQNSSIVIGFSGGPDSVFLLHFLKAVQQERALTLYAAHLNHEWRGADADADAAFCAAMVAELEIPFFQARMSELPVQPAYEGSREAQGRHARRLFLTTVQRETGAQHIALAHHADDQQETFFIRLVRGASLSGLVGMVPHAEQYIRPLLSIHKQEILDFLHEHNIAYRTDLSNYEPDYLRNRVRATIIPALKAADERFEHSFLQTLTRLQETEDFLCVITEQTFAEIAIRQDTYFVLDLTPFKKLHSVLQERILIYWLCREKVPFPPAHGFLREMIRFIESPHGGTHHIHHAWSLKKQGNKLQIVLAANNSIQ